MVVRAKPKLKAKFVRYGPEAAPEHHMVAFEVGRSPADETLFVVLQDAFHSVPVISKLLAI